MKTFHFCTISNNPTQYADMRRSFQAAGFDEERCTYTLLDNSKGNHHEPYSGFNRVKAASDARYLIFCHQDVFADRGYGYDDLVRVLESLTEHDPKWAVAGNSGVNPRFNFATRITDRDRSVFWTGSLPERVCTLDENFMVVNNSADVQWSPELSGFHFYGPDICLNSIKRGYRAYVIDFHVTHLGAGELTADFWRIKNEFELHWRQQFHLAFLVVPTGVPLVLTKYRALQALCRTRYVQRRILRPKAFTIARHCRMAPRTARKGFSLLPGSFVKERRRQKTLESSGTESDFASAQTSQ
ncbi:MAG: hypothetical protein QM790_04600 [Nibricoccus sp.]